MKRVAANRDISASHSRENREPELGILGLDTVGLRS